MRYWLGITLKEIVVPGVTGGLCQLHSKKAPLQRRQRGDHTLYYSPNQKFRSNQSYQAITACGVVTGDEVYRHEKCYPVSFRVDVTSKHERHCLTSCTPCRAGVRYRQTALRPSQVEEAPKPFQVIQEHISPSTEWNIRISSLTGKTI